MQCPSLTAGACVASRRRALHASGAPPWRRPASAAALVAAWASTAALPALFARCFGRIGVEEESRGHCSPSALAWQGRSSTAAKYGIEEGAVTSFCYACCCPGCSIIQTINQAHLHLPTCSPHHLHSLVLYRSYTHLLPDLLLISTLRSSLLRAPRGLHVPAPRLLAIPLATILSFETEVPTTPPHE